MTPVNAIVAVVLGLLACLAARLDRRPLILAAGALFVVAALLVLVQMTFGVGFIGGTGSVFSLWAGVGIGLVAAARRTSVTARVDA